MKRWLVALFTAVMLPAYAEPSGSAQAGPPSQMAPEATRPASIGKPHVCAEDYPAISLSDLQQGTTMVSFTITEAGTTTNIHVHASSGWPLLDEAAMNCAAHWLYKPAQVAGKPVAIPWITEVRWVLPASPRDFLEPKPLSLHNCKQPSAGAVPTTGATTLMLHVGKDGRVSGIDILETSGSDILDNEATKCALKWTYQPGTLDGNAVEVRRRETISWVKP